jgi:hypothetical protein
MVPRSGSGWARSQPTARVLWNRRGLLRGFPSSRFFSFIIYPISGKIKPFGEKIFFLWKIATNPHSIVLFCNESIGNRKFFSKLL